MKKTIICIMLVVVTIGLFSSCSNNETDNEQTEKTSITETQKSEWEIVTDKNTKLEKKEADEKIIKELMKKIHLCAATSSSRYEISYDDVLKYIPVNQVREVGNSSSSNNDSIYYSVNKLSDFDFFVFYRKGIEVDYIADYCFVFNPNLKMEYFENIKEGVSTFEDVKKIDSLAEMNFFNADSKTSNHYVQLLEIDWARTQTCFSAHLTKNGLVNISYKKVNGDFIVDKVFVEKDFEYIKKINKIDF